MKATLNQIRDDGLISFISKAQWNFIKFTNALAALAIITLLVVSLPEPDDELMTWLLVGALQLAIVLTVHVRADRIEKKMIEIDDENDQRDYATSNHIEVVLQDVQWLVRRELDRTGELPGDPARTSSAHLVPNSTAATFRRKHKEI